MNIDFYSRGKEEINQDYVLTGNSPFPYLIVADGCSSTPNSERASMLLAYAARNSFLIPYPILNDYQTATWFMVDRMRSFSSVLNITDPLDATLLLAWVDGDMVKFRFYGDGLFFWKDKKDVIHCYQVEFEKNMPFYLRYLVNPKDYEIYKSQVSFKTLNRYDNGLLIDSQNIPIESKLEHELFASEIKLFGIASDGLCSFFSKDSMQMLLFPRVLEEALDFKNTTGEFVKRRLRRMIREYEKKEIVQTDDVSIAIVNLE